MCIFRAIVDAAVDVDVVGVEEIAMGLATVVVRLPRAGLDLPRAVCAVHHRLAVQGLHHDGVIVDPRQLNVLDRLFVDRVDQAPHDPGLLFVAAGAGLESVHGHLVRIQEG
jgi:hypothetical protein